MKLHELQPNEGAKRSKKRVGRGPGAGQGKTAGKGTKGQAVRQGAGGKAFEVRADALVHRLRFRLALPDLGHIGIVAVGVLHPILHGKGVVDVDPDQTALDRIFSDRQVVLAVPRRMMLEQISDLLAVVGMDGGV